MDNKVCPRCQKSVGTIKLVERDPKTKTDWRVEKCFRCHFNFDLEEVTRALDTKKDAEKHKKYFRDDHDRW